VCLAAVLSPSLQNGAQQGTDGNKDGNRLEANKEDTSIDLHVPLLEFRDVYFGGQFVPFSPTKAYVPLATAESFGGLVQGLDKARTAIWSEDGDSDNARDGGGGSSGGGGSIGNSSTSNSKTVPLRGAMSQLVDSTDPCCLASRLQWAASVRLGDQLYICTSLRVTHEWMCSTAGSCFCFFKQNCTCLFLRRHLFLYTHLCTCILGRGAGRRFGPRAGSCGVDGLEPVGAGALAEPGQGADCPRRGVGRLPGRRGGQLLPHSAGPDDISLGWKRNRKRMLNSLMYCAHALDLYGSIFASPTFSAFLVSISLCYSSLSSFLAFSHLSFAAFFFPS